MLTWQKGTGMKLSNNDVQSMVRAELHERTKNGFFNIPYPGYPRVRFSCDPPALDVPDGPWSYPNTRAERLSKDSLVELGRIGIRIDSQGRPLHPWLEDFIHNPAVGVIGDTGNYWNYGPNYTADPIVISRFPKQKVLLIRRGDTGTLALPGGFVDQNEKVIDASLRELQEETALKRPRFNRRGRLIYDGPVADRRVTAHAWAHTGAVIWRTILPWRHVHGMDDATEARWYDLDLLPDELFGSHRLLVELARQVIRGEVELV